MAIFTGKHVETTGFVIAVTAANFLPSGSRIGADIALGIYLLSRFRPQMWNWLKNFAEPTTWPGFVALGVASLFAAYHGGMFAAATVGGIFMTMDGRLFDLLY